MPGCKKKEPAAPLQRSVAVGSSWLQLREVEYFLGDPQDYSLRNTYEHFKTRKLRSIIEKLHAPQWIWKLLRNNLKPRDENTIHDTVLRD